MLRRSIKVLRKPRVVVRKPSPDKVKGLKVKVPECFDFSIGLITSRSDVVLRQRIG